MKINNYVNTVKITDTGFGYCVLLKPKHSEYYTVILYYGKVDPKIHRFRSMDLEEIARLDLLIEGIN